ncbi:MAG: DUF4168 domain-containing protein [Alteraurantiacibacter sp.]
MNRIALLAGGSLLLLAAPTFAQDASVPPPPAESAPAETAAPEAAAEPAPEPAPAPETTLEAPADPLAEQFTDGQITGFVKAMTAIQALPGDDAAKQAQAVQIVTEAGIDAATYNAIGTAMQSDPALADRVRLALAAEQGAAGA